MESNRLSALRTISLRLRGTSTEILQEMGEETDGVITSVSKLQSKIQKKNISAFFLISKLEKAVIL